MIKPDLDSALRALAAQPSALLDRRAACRALGLSEAAGRPVLDRLRADGWLDVFLSPEPVQVILTALAAAELGLKLRALSRRDPLRACWVPVGAADPRETWNTDDQARPASSFGSDADDGFSIITSATYEDSRRHCELRSYPRRPPCNGYVRPECLRNTRPKGLSRALKSGAGLIKAKLGGRRGTVR